MRNSKLKELERIRKRQQIAKMDRKMRKEESFNQNSNDLDSDDIEENNGGKGSKREIISPRKSPKENRIFHRNSASPLSPLRPINGSSPNNRNKNSSPDRPSRNVDSPKHKRSYSDHITTIFPSKNETY